ncbi:hypothetical protein CHGG_04277 [Chaetomium globosum CBS 148.51]|uniref:NmrA-like domain-containing protein n=1 Tax=Chaetomium globosum (strain ATCC 6205 / CBS 148.51 / DSM 1962 / NBRC 6347 / NRRL 1970) TaxID=306901 RepID=Q2H1R9_CHAGB|nr:uncharacterized protein CHGG_04277 [Chaetomium globosum CBS 148.51]EAQ87658.1 hypothetical protein CHGG_04277 [Chaetomium globosum CBS 148.51]
MSNRPLIIIFGATGQQGGSLANFVLSNPALSARYRVRGVTRDPNQPAAAALRARGAEVVQADFDDADSLRQALSGGDGGVVFITTTTVYDELTKEREVRQGKAAADAAVAARVEYIVYSTEVHCEVVSGGKHQVPSFDSRGEVEAYIRSLPVRSAFYAPGSFMPNLLGMMAPRPVGDGEGFVIANILPGDRVLPWIDVAADTGPVVGAVLAELERFEGKRLCVASELFSLEEVAEKISKVTGKTVKYLRVSEDVFKSYLPEGAREPVVNMFRFIAESGYYGPGTEKLVEETTALLPCPLTGLDEYLAANIKLE